MVHYVLSFALWELEGLIWSYAGRSIPYCRTPDMQLRYNLSILYIEELIEYLAAKNMQAQMSPLSDKSCCEVKFSWLM